MEEKSKIVIKIIENEDGELSIYLNGNENATMTTKDVDMAEDYISFLLRMDGVKGND